MDPYGNIRGKVIREAYAISSMARDGSTFLDIGGFVGHMTYYFLQKKPNNKAIIFEPVNDSYQRICDIFKDDNRVTCINKAVSDMTGLADLYVRSSRTGRSSMMNNYKGTKTSVETISLDDWSKGRDDIDNIDTIKIDVEGAEHLVLKGARELIKRSKPTIYLEYHGSSYQQILIELNYLFGLGYYQLNLPKDYINVCLYHNRLPYNPLLNAHLRQYQ